MNNDILLNEQVEVVAVFRPGRTMCEPVRFRRPNGRVIEVTEIGLRHPKPHGARMVHIFYVTNCESVFLLEFDRDRLTWHLTREAEYSGI
jgi:hypothetical protein